MKFKKSPVFKRSVVISGHKTSVSAEAEFWNALKDIAASQERRLSDLVTDIDKTRQAGNLSSAIRLFVLDHFRNHAHAAVVGHVARAGRLDFSGGASYPPRSMTASAAAGAHDQVD
jgi:predicted DNA-binding ribbon-helix-helix protein